METASGHVRIQTPDDLPGGVIADDSSHPRYARRSSLKGGRGSIQPAPPELRRRVSISTPKLGRCESEVCLPHPLRRSASSGSRVESAGLLDSACSAAAFAKLHLRGVVNKEDSKTRRQISLEDARTSTSPLPELFHRISTLENRAVCGDTSGASWLSSGSSGGGLLVGGSGSVVGSPMRSPPNRALLSDPLFQIYLEPPKTPGLLQLSERLPTLTYGCDVPRSTVGRGVCSGCRLQRIPWYARLWGSRHVCEYTKELFCADCLSERAVVPHRVVRFWDFSPYPVSPQAKRFLDAAENEQWIDLRRIHPAIKKAHPAMIDSWHLRHDLIVLKGFYITSQRSPDKLELNPDCVETFCMHILDYLCPHMPSLGWLSDNTAMFSVNDLKLIEAASRRRVSRRSLWFVTACCFEDGLSAGGQSEFFSRLRMVLVFWKDHLSPTECEDCLSQFSAYCRSRNVTPLLF